jgi:exoribonuclease-2
MTPRALNLETIEARPIFEGDSILDLQVEEKNRAKEIIENFMIDANGVTIRYLTSRKIPSIRRVVRVPKRWERIVEIAAQMHSSFQNRTQRWRCFDDGKQPIRFDSLTCL